jgi:hypothetical protein
MKSVRIAVAMGALALIASADAKPPVGEPVIKANAPNLVPIASRMTKGTVSVRNTGSADAGPFKVTVECKNLARGGCVDPPKGELAPYTDAAFPNKLTVSVPSLGAGAVFNHKIAFWDALVWPSGNYEFTVVADAGATVNETNEADNSGGTVMGVP